MPWKESDAMSERMKFVSRILEGERMTDLCAEFCISRKTGYKILERYRTTGIEAFKDQSRAARRRPNQTSDTLSKLIVDLREKHPTWGAPKLKAFLEKKHSCVRFPAVSTVHTILLRHDLVKKAKRRQDQYRASGTEISCAASPNETWCADFKGQFKLKNGKYCYPLTVSDRFSRYLLVCEALEGTAEDECITLFDLAFERYGLPKTILSDNGVPFGSASHYGLSKLSVSWLRRGIEIQRIVPGKPQQNGSHERMHRTLKAEATQPPEGNILSQQERLDAFCQVYNYERPHQALENKCPAELYKPSEKRPALLADLTYPGSDYVLRVSECGSIRCRDFRIYVGIPFCGQELGVTQIDDDLFRVQFMHYEMGFFDLEHQKIQIPTNPFLKPIGQE